MTDLEAETVFVFFFNWYHPGFPLFLTPTLEQDIQPLCPYFDSCWNADLHNTDNCIAFPVQLQIC